MSAPVGLPALDGRTALGFLAACGLLRIAEEELGREARLSWSVDDGTAQVEIDGCDNLTEIVDLLTDFLGSLGEGQLLPGGPVGFPPRAGQTGGDPMRRPREDLRTATERWRAECGEEFVERWIPAMVSDLATDGEGRAHHTLLAAPSGKQTFNTMFAFNLAAVRKDPAARLAEALRSWRRVEKFSGEYLDHRVIRSATDTTEGRSLEAGVPGATWLALMAMPWFPVGGDGKQRVNAGWRTIGPPKRLYFVWPLWNPRLDGAAVRAVVSHPAIESESVGSGLRLRASVSAQLAALGIFAVMAARREFIPERNFAGVLVPVPVASHWEDQAQRSTEPPAASIPEVSDGA